MKLETITHGLVILLEQNHYHENTIKFYKREWEKIENFLLEQYGAWAFIPEIEIKYSKQLSPQNSFQTARTTTPCSKRSFISIPTLDSCLLCFISYRL